MNDYRTLIGAVGSAAAALGVALCVVSGLARIAGQYYLLGYTSMTIFTGGMGLMLAACLAKLHLMARDR